MRSLDIIGTTVQKASPLITGYTKGTDVEWDAFIYFVSCIYIKNVHIYNG